VQAEHDVKGAFREGQGHGISLMPTDGRTRRRRKGTSHVKHCLVHIENDHLSLRSDQWVYLAGDNARSASQVEHPLSRLVGGMAEQDGRPREEHGRDKIMLVHIGGTLWLS